MTAAEAAEVSSKLETLEQARASADARAATAEAATTELKGALEEARAQAAAAAGRFALYFASDEKH